MLILFICNTEHLKLVLYVFYTKHDWYLLYLYCLNVIKKKRLFDIKCLVLINFRYLYKRKSINLKLKLNNVFCMHIIIMYA